MKQISLKGESVILLTHKEKAHELHISVKTLTRWKKKGKMKDFLIFIPKFKYPFYFENEELISGNASFAEK